MRYILQLTILATSLVLFSGSALAERGRVVPGDYDKDNRTDIIMTRKAAGLWQWYFRLATGVEIGPVPFGLATSSKADVLLPGDFDGDGDFNLNVVRETAGALNWFSLENDGTVTQTAWGLTKDIPLTGFFGGSGESDRVAVRKVAGALVWYIQNQAPNGIAWGLTGDTPLIADIDGDSIDELIVVRNVGGALTYFIRSLSGNFTSTVSWGLKGDTILPPSDFNGDGKADLVVTRAIGGFKYIFIRYTDTDIAQSVIFGVKGDTAYIGNFSQSNVAEIAVRRNVGNFASHFVRFGQVNSIVNVIFGLKNDTLVVPERGDPAAGINSATPGCNPSPGTATDFSDGAGRGSLWKPVSEGVPNEAPVVLFPISYCGSPVVVLGASGAQVSGVQRVKCGGNGNRSHHWIAKTAGALSPFAPLTVKVINNGLTECRTVPNPRRRYD